VDQLLAVTEAYPQVVWLVALAVQPLLLLAQALTARAAAAEAQAIHLVAEQQAALYPLWPLPGRLHGRLGVLFMDPDQVVVVRVQLIQTETTTAATAAYMGAGVVQEAALLVAAAQTVQAVKVLLSLPTLWLRLL
jgi:hypothetical protein